MSDFSRLLASKFHTLTSTPAAEPPAPQAFNWESWRNGDFYAYLESQAGAIADMGFTAVWLPPPTASVSPQGYMPTDLYDLDSKYGTEAELRECLAALKAAGLKTLADAVLNHRCAARQDESGTWNLFGGRLDWDQRAIVGDDPNVSAAASLSCQSENAIETNQPPTHPPTNYRPPPKIKSQFRGRGNRSSGDAFAAAPNVDHSQVRWLFGNARFEQRSE